MGGDWELKLRSLDDLLSVGGWLFEMMPNALMARL